MPALGRHDNRRSFEPRALGVGSLRSGLLQRPVVFKHGEASRSETKYHVVVMNEWTRGSCLGQEGALLTRQVRTDRYEVNELGFKGRVRCTVLSMLSTVSVATVSRCSTPRQGLQCTVHKYSEPLWLIRTCQSPPPQEAVAWFLALRATTRFAALRPPRTCHLAIWPTRHKIRQRARLTSRTRHP